MSVKKLLLHVSSMRGTLDRLYKQRAPRDTTGNSFLMKKGLEFCLLSIIHITVHLSKLSTM